MSAHSRSSSKRSTDRLSSGSSPPSRTTSSRNGDVQIPDMSPLVWITKIQSEFARDKLVGYESERLRRSNFRCSLASSRKRSRPSTSRKAALVIRAQVDLAPLSWRAVQVKQAIEQERRGKVEGVASNEHAVDEVLRKLERLTSMNLLKVLCEGTTDRPVFKALIDQVGPPSNIIFDSVGGSGSLQAGTRSKHVAIGCKEAVMVLDGDVGRHLKKRGKPYTKVATRGTPQTGGVFPIDLRILERYGIENTSRRRCSRNSTSYRSFRLLSPFPSATCPPSNIFRGTVRAGNPPEEIHCEIIRVGAAVAERASLC